VTSLAALSAVGLAVMWLADGCAEKPNLSESDKGSETVDCEEGDASCDAGSAAATGCGTEQERCSASEVCTIVCKAGKARFGCKEPEAAAARLGEPCDAKGCRNGACLGGLGTGSRCAAFCSGLDDCATGQTCAPVSISFFCESGPSTIDASVCQDKE